MKMELETDVVVVGFGGAGATSAIIAHDSGADVIVLEKMSSGGGNTRLSGSRISHPTGMEAVEYYDAISYGTTGREIIETFVENAMKNGAWLKEIGGSTTLAKPVKDRYVIAPTSASWPHAPKSEFIGKKWVVKGTLWTLLSSNVERRGIKVMTNTPVKELVMNQKGEVAGVTAESGENLISIKAKRAVILACGGFEYDEALKWDVLPCRPFYAVGHTGNTGDGIKMGQKIGAALWHMAATSGCLGFKAPEYQAAFQIAFSSPGFVYVDDRGKRFASEPEIDTHEFAIRLSHFDTARLRYPLMPIFAIFDEVTRRRAPITRGRTHQGIYDWSLDNSTEIAKGWIIQGETVRELALKISVDELTLETTIAQYSEYCKVGRDADFGRPKGTLVSLEPPYYAIKLWPAMVNTQGGLRHDKEARVLDTEGKPIPRLYEVGEAGSIFGLLYEGAGNLAECLVFGRIAGRNAAAEKPWF